MKRSKIILLAVLIFIGRIACAQETSENTIASVRIEGNKRIATETYLYYISAKPGSIFDENMLHDDFRRLWQTGFLNDLKIEVEKTPAGVDVIFHVDERPLIKAIEYTGNKKVSTSDIETKLKDENISLRVDQPFDPFVAKKVTNAIDKLMLEKGLQFGSTKYKTEPIGETSAKLIFVVDEGPKVKIGEISFDGNKVFSDGKLKHAMKQTREHWLFSWITRHDDFEKEKYEKDIERVREIYYNNGYINAKIDEPKTELLKNKKRMRITIPVQEGSQFRTGDVTFSGNRVFAGPQMLPFIPLKKGKIFNRSNLKKGMEDLQKQYGDKGYIYASLGPVFDVKEDKKVVNVNIEVEENGQFFVNRIEFTGNNFTRDKVIRRELLLQEGDLLRVTKFRESLDRIYRLGFFDDLKPNITPVPEQKKQADISIDVKENKRNEIRLGGGYSQLEGFFGDLVFSTKNLFGSGKIFTIQIQSGSRTKNYNLQILEPYLLDHNLSLGFSIFKTRENYVTFIRATTGGAISVGFPLFEQFKGFLTYGYQVVNVDTPSGVSSSTIDNQIPGLQFLQNDFIESRFLPQLSRSTINNPQDPSRGTRFVFTHEIVGGILGGDLNYYKPSSTYTVYLPGLARRHYTAFNLSGGYGVGFGGQELPFYQRYFLGGEYSIRGYDLRSVGPIEDFEVGVDPVTQAKITRRIVVGGNKFFTLNAEYVMGLAGPLKLAGFLDYGNAFKAGDGIDFRNMRGSTGLELRFLAPFLSAPFRFIYAFNFNRGDLLTLALPPQRTVFRFSVGTTF